MIPKLCKVGLAGGLGFLGLAKVIDSQMGKYKTGILKPIDTVSIIMASIWRAITKKIL